MTDFEFNHLIRFKPLDYYFFGGETTLGNGEQSNYFAKSKIFPQQTTVLGALRYIGYKLLQNGPNEIGRSFSAIESKAKGDFGFIQSLSPIFLVLEQNDDTTFYIPGPFGMDSGSGFSLQKVQGEFKTWPENQSTEFYELPDYKEKNGWNQMLISNNIDPKKSSEVFKPLTKIGITKNQGGQAKQDAFYKQRVYKMESNWSFGVLASLTNKVQSIQNAENLIIPFGAEKALFHFSIEHKKASFKDLFPKKMWTPSIPEYLESTVLLSDTFVLENLLGKTEFAISSSKDFRYIRTPKKVKNFGPLDRDTDENKIGRDKIHKSGKYNLLSRGSILYSKNKSITSIIEQYKAFIQIGYNYFYHF